MKKMQVLFLLFSFSLFSCRSTPNSTGSDEENLSPIVFPAPPPTIAEAFSERNDPIMAQMREVALEILAWNKEDVQSECIVVGRLNDCSEEQVGKLKQFSSLVSEIFSFEVFQYFPAQYEVEVQGKKFNFSHRLRDEDTDYFFFYTQDNEDKWVARVLEQTDRYEYSLVFGSSFEGDYMAYPVYGPLGTALGRGVFSEPVTFDITNIQAILTALFNEFEGRTSDLMHYFDLGQIILLREETQERVPSLKRLQSMDYRASLVMYPGRDTSGDTREDRVRKFNEAMTRVEGFLPDFWLGKKTEESAKNIDVYESQFEGAFTTWWVKFPLEEKRRKVFLKKFELSVPTSFGTGLHTLTLKKEPGGVITGYAMKRFPHIRYLLREQGVNIQNNPNKGGGHKKFLPWKKFHEDNRYFWEAPRQGTIPVIVR